MFRINLYEGELFYGCDNWTKNQPEHRNVKVKGWGKIKNLVLLIGTNPLPNYVIGKYFVDKGEVDRLIIIYSEETQTQKGTKEYSEALRRLFAIGDCKFVFLRDVGNPKKIREDLLEQLEDINGSIHFNYTGGIKTMVAHTYNLLKEKYSDNFQSSYLDARTFKIIYDDGKVEPVDGDLRSHIKVDIKVLLKLHLYECEQIQTWKDCEFSGIVEKIKEEVIEKDKIDYFVKWIEDPFRKIFKEGKNITEKKKRFQEHVKSDHVKSAVQKFEDKTPDFIWNILDAFPEGKRINQGRKLWIPDEGVSNNDFEDRIAHTVEFLDGKWFEWYIYREISEKLKRKGLEEGKHFGISLKAKKNKDFEIDIFIINGYELTGISITTATKESNCKQKGFEIIHRVRQIGGDESKAVLITLMDSKEVKNSQGDLSFITGVSEEKFIVYGKNNLKDIGDKVLGEVFK